MQTGRGRSEDIDALVEIAIRRGTADLVVGGELSDAGGVEEPAQHQHRAPPRPERTAATAGRRLADQLGALLGGAIAPLLSAYLLGVTGSTAAISIYIIIIVIVSVVAIACTLALTETYQNEMDDTSV